jgi:phage terminase large subunit-like protein
MWFFHFFGEPQNKQFESVGVRFDASSQTLLKGEAGAEIYSAATKRDQARLVFDEAQRMVNSSPELKQVIKVHKHGNPKINSLKAAESVLTLPAKHY